MTNEANDPQFGRRICRALNEGTANLNEKTVGRLREMRHEALLHQAEPVPVLSLAGIGHGIAHFVTDSLHNHYRGILAVLALLVGAMGAQLWQNVQQATELAEIDSALLSDEVPPGAYTDQGFIEWLEHLSSEQQQEDSLPE
jgi:hypothetical protein